MQAIILAAGMGKRLGDLTKDNTKCMIKVNGTYLIDRLLSQLDSLNLERIILVIGYQGEKLRTHIEKQSRNTPIEYIYNPVYNKTNNIYSLYLAKEELQKQDTLLIESDLIFEDTLFHKILNNPYPNLALVAKYEPWMDGTMVRLNTENDIIDFISKKAFRYADIDNYYKTVNIYKFSKEFLRNSYVPFLEAYSKALGNNEYYEQVLRVITLLERCELKGLPLEGERWYEIDDIQDLDIAETIFAEQDQLQRYQKRYGGYWRFPKLKDFCYLVNPYFPPQKMCEELQANFNVLLREYPSGMGVNTLVMAKNFGIRQDYVVVGNGAAEIIKALMEHSDGKIGVIYPTFEEYPNRQSEEIIAFYPQNADFHYTAKELMLFYADKDIRHLLLINPDNPSGNFIPLDELMDLLAWTQQRNIHLILDESFVDFSEKSVKNTLLKNEVLETYPHLTVIKSISKSYGVPGLRLGLAASSDKEIISFLRKNMAIWNINSFAEFYLQIYSKYDNDYQNACKKFIAERQRFFEVLQQVDFLRVIPSQANYFLCEVTSRFSSTKLVSLLLEHNLLLKDCSTKTGFDGKNYIRIAIRDAEDNNYLAENLKKLQA
ncbi:MULTISPECIES: aminotransferase class I/II-fold pyridoxal phosphate-dependent enzyme [Bacteroidaceae]|uniref:aminotransferase class I/II-fold pyridoxal phosphate-dependent enzyme n=1 Tax=Bacteroidaceae TaxID=815 RepID=UPI00136462D7|nr:MULTISPECIES: aminotransferase class I/II-fold pyridoxal phosphate-dependent enzyme [Bacteroidaceae]NBH68218.1 aminotransferase class I/II-fold pyridoxal phosphate-dependent enzyme [Phocaeicola sartorii]